MTPNASLSTILAAAAFLLNVPQVIAAVPSPTVLADDCTLALQNYARKKASTDSSTQRAKTSDQKTMFAHAYTLHFNVRYEIPVFELLVPGQLSTLIVLVHRGSDETAEIPLIDAICADPAHKFAIDVPHQTINFSSDDTETLRLLFRLAPELKYTHWKTSAPDDSVRMVEIPDPPPVVLPEPGPQDWCRNHSPKNVAISGRDMSFDMCKNGGMPLRYKYSIHLEQTGYEQVPVDLWIDPQIIHTPH